MPFPKFGPILALLLGTTSAVAQINAGALPPAPSLPFRLTKVASFDLPWRIAFLPDGRMLVTEKIGKLFLVTQAGQKLEVTGVPPVLYQSQNGLLGVYVAPSYASDGAIYLTYSEPGQDRGTSSLALGVAPPTIDVLPPCGTIATPASAHAATTCPSSAVEAGRTTQAARPW